MGLFFTISRSQEWGHFVEKQDKMRLFEIADGTLLPRAHVRAHTRVKTHLLYIYVIHCTLKSAIYQCNGKNRFKKKKGVILETLSKIDNRLLRSICILLSGESFLNKLQK